MMPALLRLRKDSHRYVSKKYCLLLIPLLLTLHGFSFADPPGESTHKPVHPPKPDRTETSRVYIDKLTPLVGSGRIFLRIEGHLPTPCHNLGIPARHVRQDTLAISLNSWQESGRICAQVLEPFVYYMEISGPETPEPELIKLNDQSVSLK